MIDKLVLMLCLGGMAGPAGDGGAVVTECSILAGYSTTYTPDQRVMVPAVTNIMVFEAGETIVPVVKERPEGTAQVCVPKTALDIAELITDDTYLQAYAQDKAARDIKDAAAQDKQAVAEQELATNPFCTGELEDVTEKVLAEDNLQEAVVKLARCVLAMRQHG